MSNAYIIREMLDVAHLQNKEPVKKTLLYGNSVSMLTTNISNIASLLAHAHENITL